MFQPQLFQEPRKLACLGLPAKAQIDAGKAERLPWGAGCSTGHERLLIVEVEKRALLKIIVYLLYILLGVYANCYAECLARFIIREVTLKLLGSIKRHAGLEANLPAQEPRPCSVGRSRRLPFVDALRPRQLVGAGLRPPRQSEDGTA